MSMVLSAFLRTHRGAVASRAPVLRARMVSSIVARPLLAPSVAHNVPTATFASNTNLDTPVASFQRNQSTQDRPLRAFPQYQIHGETAMLSLNIMFPGFRMGRNDTVYLDSTKKGRMLLEFVPRNTVDGRYVWDDKIRFGLSVEEAGLLVNQLPHYKVEFTRVPQATAGPGLPDKVLTVEPGEMGAVNFTMDFVLDGVGGQASTGSSLTGEETRTGPIQVQVQAGEFEVLTSLIKYSIPTLSGWSQMMDIALKNNVFTTDPIEGRPHGMSGGHEVPF